jgi:membrane protein DedA with SNARE-associated domain
MDAIHATFQKYEAWAIMIAGFTPIPYKVFTIAAGVIYVNLPVFVIASLLSRGARFYLVAGVIKLFGPSMRPVLEKYFDWFALALGLLVVAGFWAVHWWHRRHAAAQQPRAGGTSA